MRIILKRRTILFIKGNAFACPKQRGKDERQRQNNDQKSQRGLRHRNDCGRHTFLHSALILRKRDADGRGRDACNRRSDKSHRQKMG